MPEEHPGSVDDVDALLSEGEARELSVLHLEENQADAEAIISQLKSSQFTVHYERVESREAFDAALERGRVDLVLLDCASRRFDGLRALAAARQAHPTLPIIIVSDAANSKLALHALKHGATEFVPKERVELLGPAVWRALEETNARRERERAESCARESEELCSLILESVRDHAIFTLSLDGKVTSWPPGAKKLFGYDEGEVSGALPTFIWQLQPKSILLFMSVAKTEGRYAEERIFNRKAGSPFYGELTMSLLGQDRGFVIVVRDISSSKQSERLLREAARRKDEFLSMLAHELRNPLAPIRNGFYLLRKHPEPQLILADVADMMERQMVHLSRLIEDLLVVARIVRGKIRLKRSRVELRQLIATFFQDRMELIEGAKCRLDLNLGTDQAWIAADAARLIQVLDNLLDNALKFGQENGRLEVTVTADEAQTTVTFRDSGIGIEASLLPHLFETFSQGDRSLHRTNGGLGLGLSIVKGLIELHGGEVEASSEGPMRGATFSIRLPLLKEPHGEVSEGDRTKQELLVHKIVLIEDSIDSANSLKLLLELEGVEVVVAHTGPEGVRTVEREQPDAVVCDIGLPGMDGFEVARAIREGSDGVRAVRLIALTGYGNFEDQKRAAEAGFDVYLVKPAEPGRILQHLERATA